MNAGVVPIGNIELLLAAGFMLVAGFVSFRFKLGLTKDIIVGTVRVFLQLLALGLVLEYVFEFQSWWLVLVIVLAMICAAVWIARGRIKKGPKGMVAPLFVSLFVTSICVTAAVVGLVIKPESLMDARTVITVAGMVLGNTMSAVAVTLDRLFADLDARSDEIASMTALGASANETAQPSIVASIKAGMIPTLSSMAAAGIVFIPGMMSGQILAGADPVMAAKYQIVILLMVSAATTLCNVIAVELAYRKRFTDEGVFLSPSLR